MIFSILVIMTIKNIDFWESCNINFTMTTKCLDSYKIIGLKLEHVEYRRGMGEGDGVRRREGGRWRER